jgi:hypothetical protein
MSEACSTHVEIINSYKILVEKPEGKDYLVDLSVDGKIILKRILRLCCMMVRIVFMCLRIGEN